MAAVTIFDRGVWAAAYDTTVGTRAFSTVAAGTTIAQVDALANVSAVKVHSLKIAPSNTVIQRPIVKGSMGPSNHLIGKSTAQVDIVFELKSAGSAAFTAGTAPEYASILAACGVSVTPTATTNIVIAPDSTVNTLKNKVDICAFHDGMWWQVQSCAGTATIDFTIGNIILVTCTLQGAYVDPIALTTYTNSELLAVPYDPGSGIVANTTTSVLSDGTTVKAAATGFDLGNSVQEHYVTGDHQFSVADRAPKLTFTKDSIGTATEWANLTSATSASITGTYKAAAATTAGTGDILTLTAPAAVRDSVAYNERAERDILDVAYSLYETTAKNDQFALTFT